MWRYLVVGLSILLVACGEQGVDQAAESSRLSVWAHAGQAPERKVLEQQIERFNAAQPDIQVQLTFLPERSYNAQVQAAAVAGELPDVLEFDGPFLFNYVWQGHLLPLDNLLSRQTQEQLLPSISDQGRYRGHLYGVGTFDSGLGLYARRSALEAAGVRIPIAPGAAWSIAEFRQVLGSLASRDPDGMVLDLKLNYSGEWFTYAFSPLLQSAGADLIDRSNYQAAGGTLDSPQAVAAMREVQRWFAAGQVDPNVDDDAFVGGRVALSWAGHWEYARYAEAAGADLILLPLPDFGQGSRTGQGSWVWGVTRQGNAAHKAARLLEFLLRPEEVLAMAAVNGAVPATQTAITQSPLYGEQGPLRLFAQQLRSGFSVPRPQTPAYPVITSAFQRAFAEIRNGADIEAALQQAAAEIDRDIRDNSGYPAVN